MVEKAYIYHVVQDSMMKRMTISDKQTKPTLKRKVGYHGTTQAKRPNLDDMDTGNN